MSSPNQGLWSTLAMFIPLLAVPFLAAIGIPQFTPTAASSEDAPPELGPLERVEIGVGESLHHGTRADDLFAPFTKDGARTGAAAGQPAPERSEPKWDDPFQQWGTAEAPPAREPRPAVTLDEPRGEPLGDAPGWPGSTRSSANAGRQLRDPDSAASASTASAPAHEWLSLDDEARSPFGDRERQDRPAPPAPPDRHSDAPAGRPFTDAPAENPLFETGDADREETRPTIDKKPLTWQAAVRRLGDLGIRDFQLKPGQGEGQFHFACTFTPPESPRIVHRFEAEALEPLAAVEKVIRQIEAWRGRP